MGLYPDLECMITDVCVPVSRLAELIGSCKKELDASPLPAPIVAHAVRFQKERKQERTKERLPVEKKQLKIDVLTEKQWENALNSLFLPINRFPHRCEVITGSTFSEWISMKMLQALGSSPLR